MSSWDELKNTFFEETEDGLQALETGLNDMRDCNGDNETVNAVFRAIHSIKGGAGVFGYESLVGFAHVFETVLDAVRRGNLAVTSEVIDALFSANDTLGGLVAMARSGESVPADFGRNAKEALQHVLNEATDASCEDLGGQGPDSFEGIEFVPVRAEVYDEQADETHHLVIRPQVESWSQAADPLPVLQALRACGSLDLGAETSDVPPLDELQPSRPYLYWTATLRTTARVDELAHIVQPILGAFRVEIAGTPVSAEPPHLEETSSANERSTASDGSQSQSAGTADAQDDPVKPAQPPATKPAVSATIRVDLERIDRVVNMVGELVIAQAMLGQIVQDLPEQAEGRLSQVLEEVIHHTRELKNAVMSMRAQPVRSVFQRMPRLVRELSAKTGKKIRLEMVNEHTEVDKTIIERLSDPLTHIIRNSIDHGIETPDERRAAGKNEEGTIRLSADHRGGRIVIEVRDDGAGINGERVLKKAREKGLVAPDAVVSEEEINNLVFMAGFSTAEIVSDISGRGVGMDVVRRNIQDLGGRISLKSERGRGTMIQLALPLTLAVVDGMIFRVGDETYVMAISAIVECIRPARSDVAPLLGTRGTLRLRGDIVPLVHLSDIFHVNSRISDASQGIVIIIEASDGARTGLVVDELCGHQQVVIKSLEENYGSVPGIAAATILGNGRVAFILDAEELCRRSGEAGPAAARASGHGIANAA